MLRGLVRLGSCFAYAHWFSCHRVHGACNPSAGGRSGPGSRISTGGGSEATLAVNFATVGRVDTSRRRRRGRAGGGEGRRLALHCSGVWAWEGGRGNWGRCSHEPSEHLRPWETDDPQHLIRCRVCMLALVAPSSCVVRCSDASMKQDHWNWPRIRCRRAHEVGYGPRP